MEDASDGRTTPIDMPVPLKNGEVSSARHSESSSERELSGGATSLKVNGDAKGEDSDGADSSDCDALVIDERPLGRRKRKLLDLEDGFKGFKRIKVENEYEPPTNPYFNESLFELSALHQNKDAHSGEKGAREDNGCGRENDTQSNDDIGTSNILALAQCRRALGKKKRNGSPKLREYAQYLGLQPTVQFKCSRCCQSGFPSLAALNDHHKQCRALGPVPTPTSEVTSSAAPSTNFRVTRKVYLCSACGTYYENWNLFLHMREVHKRFICLYCLGMFSLPDKLSLHLVSKHNCVPNQLDSEQNFFQVYKEPCFLMCCDCEKVFSEHDNFFGHNCPGKQGPGGADIRNKSAANSGRYSANQKQLASKNSKQAKNKVFVEHVTADMPQPEVSNEQSVNEPPANNIKPDQDNNALENETSVTNPTIAKENDDTKDNLQELDAAHTPPECSKEEANTPDGINNIETFNNEFVDDKSNSEIITTDMNKAELKDPSGDVSHPGTPECNHVKSGESEYEDDEPEVKSPELAPKSDVAEPLSPPAVPEEEPPTNPDLPDEPDESIKSPESLKSKLEDENEEEEDTRKVPKVTLKLPKSIASTFTEHEDSDDSDKLTVELDSMELEGEGDLNNDISEEKENKDSSNVLEPTLVVAGVDIPIVELELEQPLDKFEIQLLLQKCLKATIATCVYCNHARRIAVNGKQLGLHAIAEHRFSAIVNSITAEELIPESFVMRIKEGLPDLQNVYFNLEATSSDEGVTFSHVFECFQCRYSTMVHKELYLHNRKMHAKTILLCIMCKSNFYSYSELVCHLCPGFYELHNDVSFRCCMCVSDDLPSAFRLMVHLRKRHHACDVCLELCHNQSRLSNHVWKHKLHHLCYRCGIAYRNKPDITKHLFWKHGTESVECKKCLQKKWPHVYHFCIPPMSFTCDECNIGFTKAVALKVHKRLHSDDKPHVCSFENCTEKFISKKLLLKHEFKHREPPEEAKDLNSAEHDTKQSLSADIDAEQHSESTTKDEPVAEAADKPATKPKVDVYDLPELNLSESDSSDSEEETQKSKEEQEQEVQQEQSLLEQTALDGRKVAITDQENVAETTQPAEGFVGEQPAPVLENIWDDFKNYQASKEKKENLSTGNDVVEPEHSTAPEPTPSTSTETSMSLEDRKHIINAVMMDHDYSILSQEYKNEVEPQIIERTQSIDHDYCSANTEKEQPEQQLAEPQQEAQPSAATKDKDSSSSDSSDTNSSSCTCGSNCSCSSTSDSSSTSSDSSDSDSSSSEGRRKQQARRERRKLRAKNKSKQDENSFVDVVAAEPQSVAQTEQLIQESDLDTTESETDEDFYDKQPQKIASKLMAEKRKELLLLAGIGSLINGSMLESSRPSTPSLPETEETKPRKKSKNKKKKKKSKKQDIKSLLPATNIPSTSYQYHYQSSAVSPLTLSLPKNSPLSTPVPTNALPSPTGNLIALGMDEHSLGSSVEATGDSSLRASKRRRIPNKFYGYSSDEENEKHQPPIFKWRKADLPSPARPAPSSPLMVPPLTIKTAAPPLALPEEPALARSSVPDVRLQPQSTMVQSNFQSLMLPQPQEQESTTESNDSGSEDEPPQLEVAKPNQPPLYCYCRCPYDEVSEMIGCDASDCLIEWFHFECVGIMVPPKGQWFCPDCRKKKQQRKELAQT